MSVMKRRSCDDVGTEQTPKRVRKNSFEPGRLLANSDTLGSFQDSSSPSFEQAGSIISTSSSGPTSPDSNSRVRSKDLLKGQ